MLMASSVITSKGQTTIPLKIRSYLGLHTGDKLEFFIDKDGRVVIAPLTADASELKRLLPRPKKKVSIEKMNQIIAKRGAKHDRD
jgi:antitoxin PrlF